MSDTPKVWGQELFNLMAREHGVSLLQSELADIVAVVSRMEKVDEIRKLNADLTRQLNDALAKFNRPHGETPRTALFASQYAPYDKAKSVVDWPQCVAQWKAFAEMLERETETWRNLFYSISAELAQAEQHIRALQNP